MPPFVNRETELRAHLRLLADRGALGVDGAHGALVVTARTSFLN